MNSTYLVTGVGGFIGSKMAKYLLGLGHRVVGIDDYSSGTRKMVHPDFELIQGDVNNPLALEHISKSNFDAIFHIAGQSSGEFSFHDPFADLSSNAKSVLSVLELARASNSCPIVYASSVAVYGDPGHQMVTEKQPVRPVSPYGVSKATGENYLRVLGEHLGIPTVALRLFNVYGVGQNFSRLNQGMLSIYLAQAIKSGEVEVKGSLQRFRDFVHVDDVIEAFFLAKDFGPGNIEVNICTGVPTSVSTALRVLREVLGQSIRIRQSDGTPGDVFGSVGSFASAHELIDWSPKVSFHAGFRGVCEAELRRHVD